MWLTGRRAKLIGAALFLDVVGWALGSHFWPQPIWIITEVPLAIGAGVLLGVAFARR